MILGRSTVQWAALIAGTLAFIQIVIQVGLPAYSDESAILLPALGVLLNGWIAFLAQTATTPIKDPILPAGTVAQVQGTNDTVLIQPTPPGPVGGDASADPPTDPARE